MHSRYFLIDCQHLTLVRLHIKICFSVPLEESAGMASWVCSPTQKLALAVLPWGTGMDTSSQHSLVPALCPTCFAQSHYPPALFSQRSLCPPLSSLGLYCQRICCCENNLP